MKRWTLTFTIIFLSISAWSQCPTEDIVMHTQQDIDNFAVNYPGCTEMLNNISIGVGWAATITSLNGLSQLTSISGQLRIDNTDLVNLMGLENLQSIGGLEMRNNYNLATLTGLENLTSINNLRILKSDLASLAGLENLTAINGNLEIEQNGDLISLTGLDNITSVSGDLRIITNKSLPNMVGLEGLTSVGGWFSITGVNPFLGNASPSQVDLTSIAELENLTSVGGLLISGTTALTNLTGLENLSTIGGFSIERNDILNDLTALGNITTLGGYLRITDNDVLTDLTIFENLTAIDGFLWLEDNAILTDLTVFENLITIDGELKIDNNAAISSLMGLENIDHTTITELKITSNPNLALCDLPNICTYLENGGTVDIRNNSFGCANQLDIEQACMDIPPGDCPPEDVTLRTQAQVDAFVANFPNCTTINGDLRIGDNVDEVDAVTDISGLSMLTHIAGDLQIYWVVYLPSLNGLEQLEEIGESLRFDYIWGRVTPLNISALDHPITIGGSVTLGDINYPVDQIEPCGVQAICDHYSLSPNNVFNIWGACSPLDWVCQGPPVGDCPPGDVSFNDLVSISYFLTNYPNCTTINGNLTFDAGVLGNQIDVTTDFANLQRINGSLSIWDTEIIGAFTALDTIMGGIGVSGNSPDGLDAELHANFPVLKYVGGGIGAGGIESGYIAPGIFPVLERIEGGLHSCYQWGNPFPLTDFPNLKYIGGSITVDHGQISGLNAVDTIAGNIHFQSCVYNQISVQITGLNQLKYVGGNVIFNDTHYSINLSGMTALNAIGGDLSFDALWPTSINGLEQLKYIGGDLNIQRTQELTNLDFLSMLESVGGDVILNNNNKLNNIDALDRAVSIGGQLDISNNQQLSQCAVQAVCEHINASGVTVINNNGTYCGNLSQVEQICNETCPQGDLILTTQQEVDDFAINYPGCIGINGNLVIHGVTPNEITNLDGLASLYSVSDTLFIINNESLTDISGLENMAYSSMSHVQISGNTVLSECSITSICRYISYGGTTLIYNNGITCNSTNDILDNCTICPTGSITLRTQEEVDEYAVLYPGCKIVQHSITIQGLNDITNVHGLIGIERIEKRLRITDCNTLTELTGLDSLKYIGNDLGIWYNNALTDISSLHNLSYVDDNFFISGNDALTTLAGLDNLTNAYELYLFDNDVLVDISSLHNLKSILGLYITDNQSLTHLHGLEGITNLFFGLEVKGNDALIDLSGLNNLTHVSEKVDIGGNNSLQSLQGLNGLTFVGEDFIIGRHLHTYSNPALQTLAGLDNLNRVNGLLVISQNESLTSFNSLNNLNYVGMLSIENNDALTNFNGLQNLTTVRELLLSGQDKLSSLDGLESLQTGQSLRIEDNNRLNSLSGLDNIDHGTITDFSIKYNSSLSICNIQSVCDYLENGGSPDIKNNAPDCNSIAEIEESCNSLPIEMLEPLQVRLDNKTAILAWRTATEINNSGFEIQRSKDGIEWERIAWQAGQGNTSTPQTYSYIDQNPIFGTSYYRLKQVDFDGDAEYSNVVSLRYIRNGVTVYPNPVKAQLNLHTNYGTIQQIVIYDSNGKRITQIARPDNNIDVSILSEGIYMIKITLDEEDFYEKIIVE